MPFDNARFTLLAVLCGLAAHSFSPFGGPGVRAGVVYPQPKAAQANQFARHDIGKVADYDVASLRHNQASFSFPWSSRGAAPSERHSQKKRTMAISNAHGAKYAINHRRQASTPQWISVPRNRTPFNTTASTPSSPDGTPGTVAIVSRNPDPHNDRVLASLLLVNQSDGTYVLDASDRNATELFLIPTSDMNASTSDTYPVRLSIPLDGTTRYCATYDQAPRKPEPLTAQQCMEDGVRSDHESQIFVYNSSSGVIQPTYVQAPPSSAPPASMGAANAGLVASSDSATPAPSTSASSASWNRRDDPYAAQNVTLVFVPKRVPANAAAVQEVSTSTVTSTQTVIVFSSAAPLSASAVNAADSTSSPVVSSSGSAAMAEVTGLNVEVVGNGLPQAPLALSSVGMVAASRQPAPSNSPSQSINAAAVAASSSVASGSAPAPSPSAAGIDAVASPSPSDNSAASISSAPASSTARPIFERLSTEPYFWRFKAEARL